MINSATLAYHKRVVHGDKTYKCTLCGKDFAQTLDLKRHTNTVHFAIKNFKCSRCNKAFGLKSHLINHTRNIHEGIKYPCDECEFKASTSGNLCSHIKTVHRKVYSFPCEYCPSGFMSGPKLKKHMGSIHPDELSSGLEVQRGQPAHLSDLRQEVLYKKGEGHTQVPAPQGRGNLGNSRKKVGKKLSEFNFFVILTSIVEMKLYVHFLVKLVTHKSYACLPYENC